MGPTDATPDATPPSTPETLTRQAYKEWARAKQIPVFELNGCIAVAGWALGQEVTEADFDAALATVRGARMAPAGHEEPTK